MLRRLILLALCGLAPIFAVHAQTPTEPPLFAELHVGTAGNNQPRLIWIPTRWTPAVNQVRVMRRLAGTQPWQALNGMQDLRQREKLNLTHATPADFARLRQALLSDFTRAAVRGYATSDDLSNLPKGDYEYGLFARIGGAAFLETPVATATWTQAPPRNLDAGLKPLGLFRDANGVQGQVAVDARRMMSWAVGVRVMERRGGFASPENYPLLIPATRDGWTAICHQPKEPLPTELIFRVEDVFGNYVEQSIDVDTRAPLGSPAVNAKACMPVQPPYTPKMPRAKLSSELELFVGSALGETRILWIPKAWPPGMEGVQIMRRWGSEPWTAVGDIMRPAVESPNRLEAARNPQDFLQIRRDLRSAWREPLREGFGIVDKQAEQIPDAVVEYGAFPVIGGARSAQPVATVPWLAGSKTDADFGITGPRMLRNGKDVVAAFSVDGAKLDERAGNLRILQIARGGGETLYTEVMDGGGPRKWKYICVPVEVGRTSAVRFVAQNLFGLGASLAWPIDAAPSITTDPAAIAQCFIPPPPVSQAEPPAVTQVVPQNRPPPPSPPPPPRPQTYSPARITSAVDAVKYYPSESRRRGEQGAPIVKACVGASGALLREPEITDSSGYPALDAAAVEVAKAMRYAAGVDGGTAVRESCIRFKVKFSQSNR